MKALEQIDGFDGAAEAGWHAVNVFQNNYGLTQVNTYDSEQDVKVECMLRSPSMMFNELILCWDPFSDWNRAQ
jgi:hypothetical protein